MIERVREGVPASEKPRAASGGRVSFYGGALALASGAMIGLSTVAFIALLVFGYFLATPPEFESAAAARAIAAGWAPETWLLLWTFAAGFFLAYRGVPRGAPTGLLLGLAAALTEQTTVLVEFPPVVPAEAATYALLGGAGGLLGGMMGAQEYEKAEAGEKALFEAMVGIARAVDADEVAANLGAMMGEERVVGVGLWKGAAPPGSVPFPPSAVWASGRSGGEFSAAELAGTLVPARGLDRARLILPETLKPAQRQVWAEYGVGSAFAAPLLSAGGESLGLLIVGFWGKRWLVGRGKRRLLSAAAAAGLALEKLAVAESDRRKGKKLGILEERQRVSRELHDSVIQYLGVIAGEIDAAELARDVGREEMVWEHADRAREGARRASGEARRLLDALRSENLDGSSLQEALVEVARRFGEESGIEASFDVSGEARPLGPEREHALVRIAQEALTNARKHSGAGHLAVSLEFEGDRIRLEVSDDGMGLRGTGADPSGGFGMRSMRERAEGIGGRLLVYGAPGAGTTVVAEAPIEV